MNNFSFYKDRKVLYCLIFIWLCLSFSSSFATNPKRHFYNVLQQHQVQGTITHGSSPLPGVTIGVKNKSNNTVISDYSRQFSILAAPYDTLVVSFIGFKTVLVPLAGRKKVDISLQYDSTTLQEVRVNTGYYSVKDKERTGSIAKIKAEAL